MTKLLQSPALFPGLEINPFLHSCSCKSGFGEDENKKPLYRLALTTDTFKPLQHAQIRKYMRNSCSYWRQYSAGLCKRARCKSRGERGRQEGGRRRVCALFYLSSRPWSLVTPCSFAKLTVWDAEIDWANRSRALRIESEGERVGEMYVQLSLLTFAPSNWTHIAILTVLFNSHWGDGQRTQWW